MKKYRFLTLILPVIAVILEILPFGAVLNFGNPEGQPIRKTFSYFSLTPFGYANFAPFLCAILTCALLILCVIYAVKNAEIMLKYICILAFCTAVISICPLLMYGTEYFTVLSAFITASLALQTAFVIYLNRKSE